MADNPYATTMTFNYPMNYCAGVKEHTGHPWVVYGTGAIPSTVGTAYWGTGHEAVFPSSYGGFDAYLNIFWVGQGTWTITATAPYYSWIFGFSTNVGTTVNVKNFDNPGPGMGWDEPYSIWQAVYENMGPYGQYCILSGNEMDCTLQAGGNKGKVYSLGGMGNFYFYYWANECTGVDSQWAMCLFVEDCLAIPVNVPGASNASNPYAYAGYTFDVGVATLMPYVSSGSCWLQMMYEYYDKPNGVVKGVFLDFIWPNPSPPPPNGPENWLQEYNGNFGRIFWNALFWPMPLPTLWAATVMPGYPACCCNGTTVGGHSPVKVPIPPDPALMCVEVVFTGFMPPSTASYHAVFF
jgi:hypothetical protein